jgi:hypothetical protein
MHDYSWVVTLIFVLIEACVWGSVWYLVMDPKYPARMKKFLATVFPEEHAETQPNTVGKPFVVCQHERQHEEAECALCGAE